MMESIILPTINFSNIFLIYLASVTISLPIFTPAIEYTIFLACDESVVFILRRYIITIIPIMIFTTTPSAFITPLDKFLMYVFTFGSTVVVAISLTLSLIS